jgi:hypothetical protein
MKRAITAVLAATALAAAVASASQAAPADRAGRGTDVTTDSPCGHGGRGHGGHWGMKGGHGMGMVVRYDTPAESAALKAYLGVRPDQEDGWKSYTDALHTTAETIRNSWQGMRPDTTHKMSRDDRRAAMTAIHAQRQAAFQNLANAASTFFVTLDDAQKARAWHELPGLPSAGHGMGHGMGPGMGWNNQ